MTRKEEIQQAAIKEFPRFAERRVGFIGGAEWADKSMLDKVCDYLLVCNMDEGFIDEEFIKTLRKAMEE